MMWSVKSDANRIVANGCQLARAAAEPVIRAEVSVEYAERLAQADSHERQRLLHKMEREINRRVAEKAPYWGLY
ncbi:MAG TPA: hypothetical protein VM165_06265 [Planctomycetaceae bacterium]|nr:hypothetical protein [Planctomycetaceae bacterium]